MLVGVFAGMQFIASPILGLPLGPLRPPDGDPDRARGLRDRLRRHGLAPNMAWMFVGPDDLRGDGRGARHLQRLHCRRDASGEAGAGLRARRRRLRPRVCHRPGHRRPPRRIRSTPLPRGGCRSSSPRDASAANWLYGAFVLPESLPPENRRAFSWKRANPIGSLMALRRFRGVFDLACMYFIFYFANAMLQSIWVLYTGYRYNWSTLEVGLSLTFVGVMAAVVQGGLVKRIIAWTGERKGLVAGLLISSVAMAGYGTATQGWMIYCIVLLGAWGGISGPGRRNRSSPSTCRRTSRAGSRARSSGLASLAVDLCAAVCGLELRQVHRRRCALAPPRDRLLRGLGDPDHCAWAGARSFQLDDRIEAKRA